MIQSADFAGSSPTLLDAWLNWKICPSSQVPAGKTKLPVGLERFQSREINLMTEFGYPTSLVPSRDIGIGVHGASFDGVLDYYLGVFNGTTDGGTSASCARSYGGGWDWYVNSMVRFSVDYNITGSQGAPLADEQVLITRVQCRC